MNLLLTQAAYGAQDVLAQADPTAPPSQNSSGAEFGKSAPIGFVIILLIMVALVLLIRSMNKKVRRLPETFDQP